MSLSGPAARRFYCAFQQWATSLARPECSRVFRRVEESARCSPRRSTRHYSAGAAPTRPTDDRNRQKYVGVSQIVSARREAIVERPTKLAQKAFKLQFDVANAADRDTVYQMIYRDAELLRGFGHGCTVAFVRDQWTLAGPNPSIEKASSEIQLTVERLCSAEDIPIRWIKQWGVMHADGHWHDHADFQHALFPGQTERLVEATRSTLRTMTHPAVVVTAFGRLDAGGECFPTGVTVSSFTSVTLDPIPFISFNLKVDSRTWSIIEGSGNFRVHVFEASEGAAAVVHQFTHPHEELAKPFENILGKNSKQLTDPDGPPKLLHPSLLYILSGVIDPDKCTIVGDHVIVVGSVIDVEVRDSASNEGKMSLAYGDRSYRHLGSAIKPQATGS